jgi:hypothetical protein
MGRISALVRVGAAYVPHPGWRLYGNIFGTRLPLAHYYTRVIRRHSTSAQFFIGISVSTLTKGSLEHGSCDLYVAVD